MLPRRERLLFWRRSTHCEDVSIHAPTKGATPYPFPCPILHQCFNPRSHEGSDKDERKRIAKIQSFNPRSHEGSDAGDNAYRGAGGCFNPRSHEGSDMDGGGQEWHQGSFNPRSHEGSDKGKKRSREIDRVSIHAPTKGATA